MSTVALRTPLRLLACALILAAALGRATQVGDSYAKVIAEKGEPKSQMQAGAMRVLTYADSAIKLRDDVVVSIKAIAAPTPTLAPAANAAGQPPAPAVTIETLK